MGEEAAPDDDFERSDLLVGVIQALNQFVVSADAVSRLQSSVFIHTTGYGCDHRWESHRFLPSFSGWRSDLGEETVGDQHVFKDRIERAFSTTGRLSPAGQYPGCLR